MNPDFSFIRPVGLIDQDLTLKLIDSGHKGPKDWPFAYYKFHMVNSKSSEIMGWITLRITQPESAPQWLTNVGFTVHQKHRGNRYAVRATKLLRRLALSHELDVLWIGCSEDNIASRRCCELLDAEYVETIDVPEGIDLYDQGIRRLRRYRIKC